MRKRKRWRKGHRVRRELGTKLSKVRIANIGISAGFTVWLWVIFSLDFNLKRE